MPELSPHTTLRDLSDRIVLSDAEADLRRIDIGEMTYEQWGRKWARAAVLAVRGITPQGEYEDLVEELDDATEAAAAAETRYEALSGAVDDAITDISDALDDDELSDDERREKILSALADLKAAN